MGVYITIFKSRKGSGSCTTKGPFPFETGQITTTFTRHGGIFHIVKLGDLSRKISDSRKHVKCAM